MSYADYGRAPDLRRKPARTPAPARPRIDPQIQARIRELSLKSLDIAEGILDRINARQMAPEPPAPPLAIARRQMANLLGVPALCHHRRCRRAKACHGDPSHCLNVAIPALPEDVLARILSVKAMRQRMRKRPSR